jgi:hypothetical protein
MVPSATSYPGGWGCCVRRSPSIGITSLRSRPIHGAAWQRQVITYGSFRRKSTLPAPTEASTNNNNSIDLVGPPRCCWLHRSPRLRVAVCQPVSDGSFASCKLVCLPNGVITLAPPHGSFETMLAGSGDVPETVARPRALPEFARLIDSSTDLQPSENIPPRTSPPSYACDSCILGSSGHRLQPEVPFREQPDDSGAVPVNSESYAPYRINLY